MQDKNKGLVENSGSAKCAGERLEMQVFRGNERVRRKWGKCQEKKTELTYQQLLLIPNRKTNMEENHLYKSKY